MATVFVGLSGGVDSAVSAALLKREGHNVIGAFIKIWRPEFIECPWQKERLDAMRVCAALEIPFREIDLSDEYKKTVIDDMVSNYARGITPNPDVLCNRHIKFGAFSAWAFREGADMVATGHYARAELHNGRMHLFRGKDYTKDQSYFLWQLRESDLQRCMFPVGQLTKAEVRTRARSFSLPVAQKADSQGLCFVGDVTMRDFLAHYLPLEKGVVLDSSGKIIGEHDGAALYTLGERHGFRLLSQSTNELPHYVIAINAHENTITISSNKNDAYVSRAKLVHTNWITDVSSPCDIQTRYRETPIVSRIDTNQAAVYFSEPHLAPPGQSLVAYEGERLLGGGVVAPGDNS